MDSDQLLARTHAPDLFRPPELIGFVCLAALAFAARRRRLVALGDPRALLAASFALTPAAVFNQQIVTGLSLQPIHYELFVANYFALVSLVLTCALLWRARRQPEVSNLKSQINDPVSAIRNPQSAIRNPAYPRRALVAVALLSLGWATFEISLVARRYRTVNLELDERRAAAVKLAELARDDEGARGLVLTTDAALTDWQMGVAPQPVLWAAHMHAFGAVSPAEDRERLFTELYLTGVDAEEFAGTTLRQYRGSIFGWGRAFYGLTADYRPVTPEEERAAIDTYARFADTFGPENVARFPLALVVVSDERAGRLANLDRWYEREPAGRVGRYTFYRVRPRP
jgi:hypothetical protein